MRPILSIYYSLRVSVLGALFLVASQFFCSSHLRAQSSASDYLPLAVVVPSTASRDTYFDEAVMGALEKKLLQIATRYGMSGTTPESRFVLTPKVVVQEFRILPGAPPKIIATLDITLYIGNADLKQTYSQYSLMGTGVGVSERDAYLNAIGGIKTQSRELEQFITTGKARILEYYRQYCNEIIAEAESIVPDYANTLNLLMNVPPTSSCYADAQPLIKKYYISYMEKNCMEYLQKAKSSFAQGNFVQAATQLGNVPQGLQCSQDADVLMNAIIAANNAQADRAHLEQMASDRQAAETTQRTRELAALVLIENAKARAAEAARPQVTRISYVYSRPLTWFW